MLKVTKIEETIGFFVTFLSLVAFQFGRAPWPPWLRRWLWGYSDWYRVLVLHCHYSPPTAFSIEINFTNKLFSKTQQPKCFTQFNDI